MAGEGCDGRGWVCTVLSPEVYMQGEKVDLVYSMGS
jgi:hypothetical protein